MEKKRRQYLMHFLQPKRKENGDLENLDVHIINSNEAPITMNEDSKDSLGGSSSKDEPVSKVICSFVFINKCSIRIFF